MCRTCKADNPKWSKGVRVPVEGLHLFFASQPSWNFEQKIYGHNVVITDRARPTLTGRLGCHDIEGLVHRRQDHFLVREIFHCPGKKHNCTPRSHCTGRRRHCYALCKVTVYSACSDIAVVQFAGDHGQGNHQLQMPCDTSSPEVDVSKKEHKMRTILGSEEGAGGYLKKRKFSAFKQQTRHHHEQPRAMLAHPQPFKRELDAFIPIQTLRHEPQAQAQYISNLSYLSPPMMDNEQLSPPNIMLTSPEQQIAFPPHSTGHLPTPYPFYPPMLPTNSAEENALYTTNTMPAPNPAFWSNPGMLNYLPMTPPQGFTPYDLSPHHEEEPFGKRRKIDSGNDQIITTQSNPMFGQSADIWRPYLHHQEYDTGLKLEHPVELHLHQNEQQNEHQNQDNLLSFMMKGEDNLQFYRDNLLASMTSGLTSL